MTEEEKSLEQRRADLHFRKAEQAKEGATAWTEYLGRDDARDKKTAGLKEQRLARDAAQAASTPVKKAKGARKSVLKQTST